MGAAAIPVILVFLLVFLSWRVVFSANRDLFRAKAWNALTRRALPFAVLTLMALSLLVVQGYRENQAVLLTWALTFAAAVVASNMFSMPRAERQASKAFRQGKYEEAVENYRKLAEEQPLARHYAFLGAALGADGKDEEGIEKSTRAIEQDPKYGIAYYNRSLILRRMNRRSRAKKDLQRALEADLPRRFRGNIKGLLEDLNR
jgi:tetratricopeptide (TPR) repeat protein